MEKSAARERMNALGSERIPFIFVIDFEMIKPKVFTLDEAMQDQIFFQISDLQKNPSIRQPSGKINWKVEPITFFLYQKGFDHAMQNILHGNSYLLNLTYPTLVRTELSLEALYSISRAKYKLCFPGDFLVFSPETFVKISGNRISTYPMKGTIDASIPEAAQLLIGDPKELAEHYTIVDLMRNDLSMVSENIEVVKFRYLEKIETAGGGLLQTSSEIAGDLPADWNGRLGDILFQLLPAGSVSGAPKKKTVEIIKASEVGPRGFYTGVFGYFNGYSLDSAVMIRFIEQTGDQLFFRSGGGITARSHAEKEYQELIDKVYVPIS
jgi:para-aminobenzoate synthetase component I